MPQRILKSPIASKRELAALSPGFRFVARAATNGSLPLL
jgi:hypothetical protein